MLYETKNTELIPIDVIDTEKVIKLCERIKPDVIIWAILNVGFGEDIANKTISKLIKEIPQTRFIFLSTSLALVPNMDERAIEILAVIERYIKELRSYE